MHKMRRFQSELGRIATSGLLLLQFPSKAGGSHDFDITTSGRIDRLAMIVLYGISFILHEKSVTAKFWIDMCMFCEQVKIQKGF
jgi:hypothetical protein